MIRKCHQEKSDKTNNDVRDYSLFSARHASDLKAPSNTINISHQRCCDQRQNTKKDTVISCPRVQMKHTNLVLQYYINFKNT